MHPVQFIRTQYTLTYATYTFEIYAIYVGHYYHWMCGLQCIAMIIMLCNILPHQLNFWIEILLWVWSTPTAGCSSLKDLFWLALSASPSLVDWNETHFCVRIWCLSKMRSRENLFPIDDYVFNKWADLAIITICFECFSLSAAVACVLFECLFFLFRLILLLSFPICCYIFLTRTINCQLYGKTEYSLKFRWV